MPPASLPTASSLAEPNVPSREAQAFPHLRKGAGQFGNFVFAVRDTGIRSRPFPSGGWPDEIFERARNLTRQSEAEQEPVRTALGPW
jgi:hypothetical protein